MACESCMDDLQLSGKLPADAKPIPDTSPVDNETIELL